jgi:uncharacterized Zn finger protein (UPF0148 family)
MSLTRAVLWIMIGSLVLAAALGIATIILPTSWRIEEQVIVTLLVFGVYTIPAFGLAVSLQKNRYVPLMWSSLIALGLAVALWMLMLWGSFGWESERIIGTLAASLTTVGVFGAMLAVLSLLKITTRIGVAARSGTLLATGLAGLMLIIGLIFEPHNEVYVQSMAVLFVLAACGTLVTPMLALIEMLKARTGHGSVPSRVVVKVCCPRCGLSQMLKAGEARCGDCNLRIAIEIEEPRCTCGYLLYKLQGITCPECGRELPASERWATHEQSHQDGVDAVAQPVGNTVDPPSEAPSAPAGPEADRAS